MGIYILVAFFFIGIIIVFFGCKKQKKTEERKRDLLYDINAKYAGLIVCLSTVGLNIMIVCMELFNIFKADKHMNQMAIITISILLNLFYLIAIWFVRLKIEVWKNKIVSTYPWGKRKEILYTEVREAAIVNGKLVLYDEDGEKLFSYPNSSDGIFLENVIEAQLKQHGILVKRSSSFEMFAPVGYRVLYGATLLANIILLIMSIYHNVFEGIVIFGVILPFSIYSCLDHMKTKYIFDFEYITVKKVLKKERKYLLENIIGYNCHASIFAPQLHDDAGLVNPDKELVLYTNDKGKVVIPTYYTNMGALGMLIKKRNWKQK